LGCASLVWALVFVRDKNSSGVQMDVPGLLSNGIASLLNCQTGLPANQMPFAGKSSLLRLRWKPSLLFKMLVFYFCKLQLKALGLFASCIADCAQMFRNAA
jgi:hypothetical protein